MGAVKMIYIIGDFKLLLHLYFYVQFTFKTMEVQTKKQEAKRIDEYNFNNHVDNSIVSLRETSPIFSLAPMDGFADRNSGRGKKRRR